MTTAEGRLGTRGLTYWLRWFGVLPIGLLVGILSTFPLHWSLWNTLSEFVEPYPKLPERLLTPFVIAATFIFVGSRVAPERKAETAVVLFGLQLFLLGALTFLTLTDVNVIGSKLLLYFQANGISPIMSFAGSVTGLWIARKSQTGNLRP